MVLSPLPRLGGEGKGEGVHLVGAIGLASAVLPLSFLTLTNRSANSVASHPPIGRVETEGRGFWEGIFFVDITLKGWIPSVPKPHHSTPDTTAETKYVSNDIQQKSAHTNHY